MGGGKRELMLLWAKEQPKNNLLLFKSSLDIQRPQNIYLIEISDPTYEISPYSLGQ